VIVALSAVLLIVWPVEAASAKVVTGGPRSSRAVALTFDDGWGSDPCERIGRTLRSYRVTGTFFINTIYLRRQPARWRAILRGMPVGNHTRSHLDLTTLSASAILKEIRYNEAVHEKILRRPMLKALRPPYGAYDARVRRVAGRLGYQHLVLWNRTAADTSSVASISSIIRHATGASPGAIILMHCARATTAQALPAIIRHYRRRGIRMIGLDEMLGLGAP
jgi:peptidoglycan/xylan/chitin deacetylase (PgdA/CDA1 family)